MLNCPINGQKPGVMVPVPMYPLYSASIVEFNMVQIEYYLDESNNLALNIQELERAIEESKKKCFPRAIVIINPGNPTGQVLTKKNIKGVVKFATKHGLYILADEVYQHNIYDPQSKFFSFKKILMELGEPYNKTQLSSFMSCSKGFIGECGIRGGYVEIVNMKPDVKDMFYKYVSAQLCSNLHGQIVMSTIVNPPKSNEPSYKLYEEEKKNILQSLKERAKMVASTFQACKGFNCNPVQGAMYAFPRIILPPKAIEAAATAKEKPDVFYAFQLLENTGICIIPGSGFGQVPGTYHFRTTILPQPDLLKEMLNTFKTFHEDFYKKFS